MSDIETTVDALHRQRGEMVELGENSADGRNHGGTRHER